MIQETLAYVYKWTHIPTMRWYVGSRTAEGCHPDDGYLCSSKEVKPMILESKSEWKREIIATGTPAEMYELETEILQLFDARNDSRSFNGHNNNKKFNSIGNPNGNCGAPKGTTPWNKDKHGVQVNWNKGLPAEKQPNYGKTPWNKGISAWYWINNNIVEKRIDNLNNIPQGFELGRINFNYSNTNAVKGTKWFNNGVIEGMFKTAPLNWSEGRLSKKRYYHNGIVSKKFISGTEPNGFVSGRLIAKRRTRAEMLK